VPIHLRPVTSYLISLIVLAGCGGSSPTYPPSPPPGPPPPPPPPSPVSAATVEVRNTSFSPETVVLNAGGTVTWTWVGQGHSVTSVLSPGFAPNSAVESAPFTLGPITFPTPGTYRYICSIHGSASGGQTSGMRGVIIVQ